MLLNLAVGGGTAHTARTGEWGKGMWAELRRQPSHEGVKCRIFGGEQVGWNEACCWGVGDGGRRQACVQIMRAVKAEGAGCVLGSWSVAAWSLRARKARGAVRIIPVGDEGLLGAGWRAGAAAGGAFLRENPPTSIEG